MLQPALLAKLHPDKIWFLLERKTHWSMGRTKDLESSWICLKNTEKIEHIPYGFTIDCAFLIGGRPGNLQQTRYLQLPTRSTCLLLNTPSERLKSATWTKTLEFSKYLRFLLHLLWHIKADLRSESQISYNCIKKAAVMCRLCHAPQNTTNPILRPLSAIKQIQMGSWMCTTVSKWCTTMHIYIYYIRDIPQ